MQHVALKLSSDDYPTKNYLYSHLCRITQVLQERTRENSWGTKDEISDILLWVPKHGDASVGRSFKHTFSKYMKDTRCHPEDLPAGMMGNLEDWGENVMRIYAISTL